MCWLYLLSWRGSTEPVNMKAFLGEGGDELDNNLRCICGKIVCQLEDHVVLIKCRHCKREIILEFDRTERPGKDTPPRLLRPKIEYR